MTNKPRSTTPKTPLQLKKEKVAAIRRAIAQAEALEQAEAELEEAEVEAELELLEKQHAGLLNPTKEDTNSTGDRDKYVEEDTSEDISKDSNENLDKNDSNYDEYNSGDEYEEEISEPVTTPARVKKSRATEVATPAQKKKVRTRTQERELEALGLPPHVSSWEITDSPETEDTQIITFFAEGEPVTYIDITPENMEDMMIALNSAIIVAADYEVTGWTLRVPEDTDIPPLLSFTSNGAVIATLPLDDAVLKQLIPKLEAYSKPETTVGASFIKWATKHKIVSGFFGLLLLSTFLYGGYTALF